MQEDFKIGDPIMIERGAACVYGRVSGFDGTAYRGVFPIIHLRTPHGSKISAGRLWFRRVESEADRRKLEDLEAEADAAKQEHEAEAEAK